MIKIYQPIANPYTYPNPFIYAMMDGIDEQYDDIKWSWGHELFWTDRVFNYNIVLIQWPEKVLTRSGNLDLEHDLDDYRERLLEIKSRGITIISFVHDTVPHYCKDSMPPKCNTLVYSTADILLHMGEYSKNDFEELYPHVKHVNLGPHFLFNQVYKKEYTKEQGCAVLGFNPKYKYVLAFGAFRDDEERELVFNLAEDLKTYDDNIMILAPGFMNIPAAKGRFDIAPRLTKYNMKHKKHIICNGRHFMAVSEELLPYYYAVADVCFLHRKKILNSGNVPMAFLMIKVIAGPNVGNVGEILKKMDNPVFDVDDRKSVCNSVKHAFELAKVGKGKWNHSYAMEQFSTEIFSKKLHDVFIEATLKCTNP